MKDLNKYQMWLYYNRPGEDRSFVVIQDFTDSVVYCSIVNIKLTARNLDGLNKQIVTRYLPCIRFDRSTLENSLIEKLAYDESWSYLNDMLILGISPVTIVEQYKLARRVLEANNGNTCFYSIAAALDYIQETVKDSNKVKVVHSTDELVHLIEGKRGV